MTLSVGTVTIAAAGAGAENAMIAASSRVAEERAEANLLQQRGRASQWEEQTSATLTEIGWKQFGKIHIEAKRGENDARRFL